MEDERMLGRVLNLLSLLVLQERFVRLDATQAT